MTTSSATTDTEIFIETPTAGSLGNRWGVLASFFTISLLTLLVKVVAFSKDLVAAHHFGTSDDMDAFLIAYLIPAMIPMLFAQGVPTALIPAYTETGRQGGQVRADRLAVEGIWVHAAVLAVVIGLTALAQPWILSLLAPVFVPAKQALTTQLFTSLFPFCFGYGLSFYFINWLQVQKRFVLCSVAPALIPLTTLVFLLCAGKTLGVWAFVYGANLGALLLVSVLAYAATRGCQYPFQWPRRLLSESWQMARESVPLLVGGVLMVGLPVLDQMMAGWLESGSVAVLNYGEKICSIALSLIAGAAGQALYPYLAELVGRRDWAGLKAATLRYSLLIVGGSLPVVALFWFGAPMIVRLLFQSGAFEAGDTLRVAEVLRCLALQIPFYIAAVVASRVVLALRAGKVMLIITVVNLAANTFLNLWLMRSLGVAGLALATGGVYLLSAVMLYSYMLFILPRHIQADAASLA